MQSRVCPTTKSNRITFNIRIYFSCSNTKGIDRGNSDSDRLNFLKIVKNNTKEKKEQRKRKKKRWMVGELWGKEGKRE